MDQTAHTHALHGLSPTGGVFDTQGYDLILRCLAGAAARVDDTAEGALQAYMPDTCAITGDLIPEWAEFLSLPAPEDSAAWALYTDAQKQAAILARLRAIVAISRVDLEAAFREYRNDPALVIIDRAEDVCEVGTAEAGDGCGTGAWAATWLCEYMDDILTPARDDFEAWTGTGVATNDSHGSPATEDATAAEVVLDAGEYIQGVIVPVPAEDHAIRFAIYARADAGTATLRVHVQHRHGEVTTQDFDLTETWTRITWEGLVGEGATAPFIRLTNPGSTTKTYRVSWAFAGSKDSAFESWALAQDQIHFYGVFAVKGEVSDAV